MTNHYFDLHFHPAFKKFITRYEDDVATTREDLTGEIRFSNSIVNTVADWALQILLSQCCIDQCRKGKVKLGVMSIANLELGFAASRGFMAEILKSKLTAPLDKKYFDKIKNGEISYFRAMLKELDIYLQLEKQGHIKLLSRKTGMPEADDSMHLAFSLEGGHNLSRMMVGRSNVEDRDGINELQQAIFTNNKNTSSENIGVDPAESLDQFHQVLWDNNYDLMYITLTHLSFIAEQSLATHAYGMKMLKHPLFYPVGSGLTHLGRSLIEKCYALKRGTANTPVFVDVKHMSLKGRMDFYQFMKEMEQERVKKKLPRLPFIASHAGVTGYTVNEWKGAMQRDKCRLAVHEMNRCVEIETERKKCGEWGSALNNEFTFNPWSINLMDEDIVEIIESGGIIGITLDTRILGFQNKKQQIHGDSSEYLSTADFQSFFPYVGLRSLKEKAVESMVKENESWAFPTKEERHPLCLCFNIIHIMAVALLRTSNREPWKHICIGTDFDGLVDPVKVCPSADSMGDLRFNLLKWLPVAAVAYRKENGGTIDVYRNMDNKDELEGMVDWIMYYSGRAFINYWMNFNPLPSIDAGEEPLDRYSCD